MQITLVWFQDLQWLKKKKNLIDNQRDTICFQEIASFSKCKNPCSDVQLLKLYLHGRSTHSYGRWNGTGWSSMCRQLKALFIHSPLIQPPVIKSVLIQSLLGAGLDLGMKLKVKSKMPPPRFWLEPVGRWRHHPFRWESLGEEKVWLGDRYQRFGIGSVDSEMPVSHPHANAELAARGPVEMVRRRWGVVGRKSSRWNLDSPSVSPQCNVGWLNEWMRGWMNDILYIRTLKTFKRKYLSGAISKESQKSCRKLQI